MEKTYTFDFNLQAWIRGLKIEASSKEEAYEKLYKMSLSDLQENGDVHDTDMTNIDCDYTPDVKVKVTNIKYDIDEEDEEENGKTREEILSELPTEMELTFSGEEWSDYEGEEEILISDTISDKTGWLIDTFKYTVEEIEEK